MNRRILSCSLVVLAALSFSVLAQSKTKRSVGKNDKPVTVTLLRWPYT